MTIAPGLQVASRVLRLHRSVAEFQHRGKLDQLRLVLVGVMLTEQKFRAGGQCRAHACSGAAPVAPIRPG